MRLNLGTLYHKKYWRITADFYEEKRKGYRGKQNEINDKMSKLHTADEEYYLTAQHLIEMASRAKELFMSSEPEEKRLILKMTLQNSVLDGKNIVFDWIKSFGKIAFYAYRPTWLPRQDSLHFSLRSRFRASSLAKAV